MSSELSQLRLHEWDELNLDSQTEVLVSEVNAYLNLPPLSDYLSPEHKPSHPSKLLKRMLGALCVGALIVGTAYAGVIGVSEIYNTWQTPTPHLYP